MKKSPPVHTIVMRHYQHVAIAAELFLFANKETLNFWVSECQSLVNHNSLTKQTFLGAMLLNENILRGISLLTLIT
jgi:hypothetical protein